MELFYHTTLLLTLLNNVYGCPEFCTCSLLETKCTYADCEGELPYEETYVLEIRGKLCEVRRELLSTSPSFANTLIRLHDDFCIDIPNCRSRAQVTTEFPHERIVPPLLPRDPDDVFEFGHHPIEEELQPQQPEVEEEEDVFNRGEENDDDDDGDENVPTTTKPSVTDSTSDLPTTSDEDNDTAAERSWLSRQVTQIGFAILGVVGLCLLVATVALYCLYQKIRKRLSLMQVKSKNSDEDLATRSRQERGKETEPLVNGSNQDEERGAVGGVSRDMVASMHSSDESVVFDRAVTMAAKKEKEKKKRKSNSNKEE